MSLAHLDQIGYIGKTRVFEAARAKNWHILGLEAFDILQAYGIPVVKAKFAKTAEEAIIAAEEIGYPLVMKFVSPQISHNTAEVKATYEDIRESILKKLPEAYKVVFAQAFF